MRTVMLFALSAVLLSAHAQEAKSANPLAAIYACAELEDPTERLACYDAASGRLKAAEETREITVVSKAEVEAVRRESFGFSLPTLPKLFSGDEDGESDAIETVTLAVTDVELDGEGKLRVTLEGGAVWQQIDTTRVRIKKSETVKEATIEAASFGSFFLKLDDRRGFRARRIK
jgi:hypothetical protein